MAGTGNILSAQINVTLSESSKRAFKNVADAATGSLSELKQISKSLKTELSGLDAQMIGSKGGKVLAKELSLVTKEIKVLERQANISGAAAGNALTKGFSGLRTLAHILPGLGIAGIFNIALGAIGKFTSGLNLVGRAFNAAAVDAALFKKASAESTDDVVRLQALVSVAKDVSFSTNQRKNAIAELQKLYPDYLRNLSLETINSDAARKAIDDLTQSIINKALVQEFSTRLAKEIIKQEELREKVLNREAQSLSNINQKQKLIAEGAPSDAIKKFTGIVSESINKLGQETKEFREQSEVVDHLKDRLKQLTASSLDFIKTPKAKKFKAEFVAEFVNRNRGLELREQLANDIIKEFEKRRSPIKIPKLLSPVEIRSFNINLDTSATNFSTESLDKISSDIRGLIERLTASNPILIRANAKIELTADQKALLQTIENIQQILERAIENSFTAFGEGLGEALAGGEILDAFKGFASVVGGAVKAIGQQLIALGVTAKAAQIALKGLFKNPVAQIAVGVALVAIGTAMQKLLSGGVKGFASGGYTGPGGKHQPAGIVHKGEYVIPAFAVQKLGVGYLNNLAFGSGIKGYASGGFVSGGSVGGGIAIEITGQNITRGQDIITVYKAALRSQGRNF